MFTTVKVGKCLLRHRLQKSGITARRLSEVTGIKETQLSAYANNHRVMRLNIAKTIASALNCKIDDLYEWIELDEDSQS